MAAVSSKNVARRTLADISNLPVKELVRAGKPQSEKVQLMKILADRDKIIEVTKIELQKLQVNQEKLHEQNKQLAQSNSHLLAEMNATKDKIKELQHQFACQNELVKALQNELSESKIRVHVLEEELTKVEDLRKLATTAQGADKQVTFKRRTHSKSLRLSLQAQTKNKTGNKRAYVRRQTAKFKSQEADSTDDSFAMPETKLAVYPPPSDFVVKDGAASEVATVEVEEDKDGNAAISHEQIHASIGRPSRVAAKKVQSYKEVPLKVKMRRPD